MRFLQCRDYTRRHTWPLGRRCRNSIALNRYRGTARGYVVHVTSALSLLLPDLLHAMLLVGHDLSCEWQAWVEAEVGDGGEHRLSRFGCCLEPADDAAFVARVADSSHATVCRHGDATLLAKCHLHVGGQACRDRQSSAEPLHQTFNLLWAVDHRHAAKAASDLLGSRQFHGSRLCSSCAFVRLETIRSSTSVRYAIGSMPLA